MAKNFTTRAENYSQWYNDIVKKADLAENSAVRGCMVIKPYGYAIWEKMHDALDKMFKDTGHVNAYFPLFIPKSFLSREADHVEGFAKECAVITHYRLKNSPDGSGVIVDPEAKLEEELIVRPTSETIIWRYSRTATCRCSATSGPTWCAGRCAPVCSSARPSSCGRKAIPPMPPSRKLARRPLECWRCMPISPRITWPCPS